MGTITAKAEGKAEITVTTFNGISKTCTVNVVLPEPEPEPEPEESTENVTENVEP